MTIDVVTVLLVGLRTTSHRDELAREDGFTSSASDDIGGLAELEGATRVVLALGRPARSRRSRAPRPTLPRRPSWSSPTRRPRADGAVAMHAGAEDHLVRGSIPAGHPPARGAVRRRDPAPPPELVHAGRRVRACRTSAGSRRSPSTTCGWPTAPSSRWCSCSCGSTGREAARAPVPTRPRPGARRGRGLARGRADADVPARISRRHVLRAADRRRQGRRPSCCPGWSRPSPFTTPAATGPALLALSVGAPCTTQSDPATLAHRSSKPPTAGWPLNALRSSEA